MFRVFRRLLGPSGGPKMAPRGPQDGPRWPPDGPKSRLGPSKIIKKHNGKSIFWLSAAPRWTKMVTRWHMGHLVTILVHLRAADSQNIDFPSGILMIFDGPKMAQDGPKMA